MTSPSCTTRNWRLATGIGSSAAVSNWHGVTHDW
jgi:hypothetical protein